MGPTHLERGTNTVVELFSNSLLIHSLSVPVRWNREKRKFVWDLDLVLVFGIEETLVVKFEKETGTVEESRTESPGQRY